MPAWHVNLRKQKVKAPKLSFFDTGLVCYLLGIREPEQLRLHPLREAIFETWVVSEIYKVLSHRGLPPNLFHYRETRGPEIDLLIDQGQGFAAVEIKSGATIGADFFTNLMLFEERISQADPSRSLTKYVVYGGETDQQRAQ